VICANPRCKRSFTNEKSWERIDKGTELPTGRVTADLNYCSLDCVYQAHPHEPVKHGG